MCGGIVVTRATCLRPTVCALLVLFVLVASASCWASSGSATETPKTGRATLTTDDLIAIATHNQQNIEILDITYVVKQEPVDRSALKRPIIEEQRVSVISAIDDSRFYWRRQMKSSPDGDFGSLHHFAWDGGQLGTTYTPARKRASLTDERPPIAIAREHDVLLAGMLLPSTEEGIGLDDASLVSLLRAVKLREQTEYVDTHECHVVDLVVRDQMVGTFWIDATRGAVVLKKQLYGRDGKPNSVQRVSAVEEFIDEDGRTAWLPVEYESNTYNIGVFGTPLKKRVTVDVKKTRLNPAVSDETFRIKIPPGTRISDRRSGQVLSYTLTGELDVLSDESIADLEEDITADLEMKEAGETGGAREALDPDQIPSENVETETQTADVATGRSTGKLVLGVILVLISLAVLAFVVMRLKGAASSRSA